MEISQFNIAFLAYFFMKLLSYLIFDMFFKSEYYVKFVKNFIGRLFQLLILLTSPILMLWNILILYFQVNNHWLT